MLEQQFCIKAPCDFIDTDKIFSTTPKIGDAGPAKKTLSEGKAPDVADGKVIKEKPQASPKKSNTMLYVGGVLVLAVIAFVATRPKKKALSGTPKKKAKKRSRRKKK